MPRTIVGGRPFDFDKDAIERKMRDVQPEPIREHLVEAGGTVYPPKQVFAVVTGWARTSYTTMEAQRALTRAGMVCRRAAAGTTALIPEDADEAVVDSDAGDRLLDLEMDLRATRRALEQLAQRVDQLAQRVDQLESAART